MLISLPLTIGTVSCKAVDIFFQPSSIHKSDQRIQRYILFSSGAIRNEMALAWSSDSALFSS